MYIACIEAHIVTTMKSLIKMVKYMPMVHLYKRKYVVYIYYRDIYTVGSILKYNHLYTCIASMSI